METKVLTKLQAEKQANETGYIHTVENEDILMFTDEHGIPKGLDEEDFVPITCGFPLLVTPRKGLEDGLIDTLDKFLFIFGSYCDKKLNVIETLR